MDEDAVSSRSVGVEADGVVSDSPSVGDAVLGSVLVYLFSSFCAWVTTCEKSFLAVSMAV